MIPPGIDVLASSLRRRPTARGPSSCTRPRRAGARERRRSSPPARGSMPTSCSSRVFITTRRSTLPRGGHRRGSAQRRLVRALRDRVHGAREAGRHVPPRGGSHANREGARHARADRESDERHAARAARAARRLSSRAGGPKLFAPLPPNIVCTEIYGGPQKARVVGTVGGKRIWATFARRSAPRSAAERFVVASHRVVTIRLGKRERRRLPARSLLSALLHVLRSADGREDRTRPGPSRSQRLRATTCSDPARRSNWKRLAKHSAIYGLGGLVSRFVALLLLPLYTRYLTPADYGAVETLVALTRSSPSSCASASRARSSASTSTRPTRRTAVASSARPSGSRWRWRRSGSSSASLLAGADLGLALRHPDDRRARRARPSSCSGRR